jgi:hypothetical protein
LVHRRGKDLIAEGELRAPTFRNARAAAAADGPIDLARKFGPSDAAPPRAARSLRGRLCRPVIGRMQAP